MIFTYAAIDRERARLRRTTNVAAKLCLNGAHHGPATHGRKCRRCFAVHRYGAVVVKERGLDALDLTDRRVKYPICISQLGAA